MSPGRRARGRRAAPWTGAAGALALALLSSACAGRSAHLPRPAPDSLPVSSPLRSRTLADGDAWLRHHLMYGEHRQALEVVRRSPVAPSDRLLRALQEGMVLHQAGEHARSNQVLDWAEVEADRRYTRSVSRAVASLAVNDRVMGYTPSAAELVMIPYYRMLNHLALGDGDGAVVEARKATALLERLGRGELERCREDGVVLHLAGLVQGAAGERNDALVSLRQAERAFGACEAAGTAAQAPGLGEDLFRAARALGLPELADSVAQRYQLAGEAAPTGGEVVLLVEQGFVAHRAQEALHVPIFPSDTLGIEGEGGVATAAARVADRLLQSFAERSRWGRSADDHPVAQWGSALEGAYILRLAWPVLSREHHRAARVRLLVDSAFTAAHPVGDLSAVVEREMAADRPAMLARLVGRGMAKYLLTREAEKQAEKQGGELAAFLVGRLSNLAVNELERADTRSWSLLPDRISMARVRLPAGEHRIRLEVAAPDGTVELRDLGPVSVQPGTVVVLSHRVME